ANTCSDGNACTTGDHCSSGSCVGTPVLCNDNNSCTDDSCNPGTGMCVYVNNDANTCSDGNACTTGDHCSSGTCVGTPVVCNDGNSCTDDSCNPGTGMCVYVNNDANSCSDGNACTTGDHCSSGSCVGTPVVCNDSNSCTDDSCNPGTGMCVYVNNDANPCSDGNACTTGDHCSSGSCVGTPVLCNDN